MKRFLPVVLLAFLPLPTTLSAQQWGRGLIPGDSIRASTSDGWLHGRFVMWDSDLLRLSDTTLHRGSVFSLEVWEKRDAGRTFALSALYGLAGGVLFYLIDTNEPRNTGLAVGVGIATMFLGYGADMVLRPGKWKPPEKVRR